MKRVVAQSRNVTYAMSNIFGFGGHIASSIFKKIHSLIKN